MSTLTIELPETVGLEIQRRGIPVQQLQKAITSFVEIYVREAKPAWTTSPVSGWSDGAEFARRVIANNRELFEELARL
jgi:hypothetical protein